MNEKLKFWLLFVGYVCFTYLAPILILINKFEIYEQKKATIVFYIIITFIIVLVFKIGKSVLDSLGYTYLTQIIRGVLFLIAPLVLAFLFMEYIAQNVIMLKEILLQIIIVMSIGIFLNPLPKWANDKKIANLRRELNLNE